MSNHGSDDPHRADPVVATWEVPPPDPALATAIESRARIVIEDLAGPDAEASLVFTDDDGIRDLNARFRGVDAATDVLSFSLLDGDHVAFRGQLLGDVVISLPTARRASASPAHRDRIAESLGTTAFEWDLLSELTFLMIHGCLHLVGHDHAECEETARMRSEEARLMRRWLRAPTTDV